MNNPQDSGPEPEDRLEKMVERLAERLAAQRYPARAWPARPAARRVRPVVAILVLATATTAAAALIVCTWLLIKPATPVRFATPVIATHNYGLGTSPAVDVLSQLDDVSLDPCIMQMPSEDVGAMVLAIRDAIGQMDDLEQPAKTIHEKTRIPPPTDAQ